MAKSFRKSPLRIYVMMTKTLISCFSELFSLSNLLFGLSLVVSFVSCLWVLILFFFLSIENEEEEEKIFIVQATKE